MRIHASVFVVVQSSQGALAYEQHPNRMKKDLMVILALVVLFSGGYYANQLWLNAASQRAIEAPVETPQPPVVSEVPSSIAQPIAIDPTIPTVPPETPPESTPAPDAAVVPPVVVPTVPVVTTPTAAPAPAPKPVAVAPVKSASCGSLNPPTQNTEIVVDSVEALEQAVAKGNETGRVTISIKNGTYTLTKPLWISGSDLFFRSQSGNRDDVTLRGAGMRGEVASVFQIAGDRVTVANLTVGWVANHPIQVHGELDADDVRIHNVHVTNGYQQLLKASYDAEKPTMGSDRGVVDCSRFDYSAGIGPNYYIGGIDVHNGKDWIVRDNTFFGIRSPQEEVAEHAIHFWSNSRNTVVERNTILNSDRGIGFGLGDRGHMGGIIRNNVIYHDATRGDVGIALESSPKTEVYGNHLYSENDYPYAIEYRFETTKNVNIHDNVTNKLIRQRDGATGSVTSNITEAGKETFAEDLKRLGL